MNNKLSVIVPVYNTEKYLSKCLNSIVNQSYKNLEILIINDGSTDGSLNIIKKFEDVYSNVFVYNKENSGVADTRNFGIQKATGDFITFVDSDDFIELDLYQICMDYIEQKNIDILMFDFIIENNGKLIKSSVINYDDKCEMYLKNSPNPWNKIIRKSLWDNNKIFFPKGIWYEDLATFPLFYLFTNKIDYIPLRKYHYIIRNSSITHRDIYDIRCKNIIQALDRLKKYFDKYNKLEELESLFVTEGLYFGTQASVEFLKKEDYKEIVQYVTSIFPNCLNNKIVHSLGSIKRFYLYNLKHLYILHLLVKVRKLLKK